MPQWQAGAGRDFRKQRALSTYLAPSSPPYLAENALTPISLDLTCEFTESIAKWPSVSYLGFPMLDGSGATAEQLRTLAAEITKMPSPVLIHCAQGHGRTGLVAAAVLLASGKAQTAEEAIAMIQSVRPGVELNRMQRSLLEKIE